MRRKAAYAKLQDSKNARKSLMDEPLLALQSEPIAAALDTDETQPAVLDGTIMREAMARVSAVEKATSHL